MDKMQSDSVDTGRSAFLPLLIIALASASWGAFQAYQLVQEHEALKKLQVNQESMVQNAVRMRAQLDGIAGDTQKLANSGNANAQAIVQELARRGVTINPDGPSAAGNGEAKK
jgi:hypothetical protein